MTFEPLGLLTGLHKKHPMVAYSLVAFSIAIIIFNLRPSCGQDIVEVPRVEYHDYVFIYSPYCGYCRAMMPQVAQYPFLWVPADQQLADKYNLTGVPAFIICGRFYTGYQNLTAIMEVCES